MDWETYLAQLEVDFLAGVQTGLVVGLSFFCFRILIRLSKLTDTRFDD